MSEVAEPTEDDSIDCHLQEIGMGILVCRAARRISDRTTEEVTPKICFNCEAGKIFREVGCNAVTPKMRVLQFGDNRPDTHILSGLFCSIRKRYTSLDYCRTCGLATAETTRRIVSTARGLFQNHDFHSSFQDIEKAREAIRDADLDNAITRSVSCFESTMRICHEKLGKKLPGGRGGKALKGMWNSTREILHFEEFDATESSQNLMNTLTGVVQYLGEMRNELSSAHGKGIFPPAVSEAIAELALNITSALSTTVVRRFAQMEGGGRENVD